MVHNHAIEIFQFGNITVQLCIPNQQQVYYTYKLTNPHQPFPVEGNENKFPYWAKVWHSAIALSEYIVENALAFTQKNILELAAGLGLPSMVVSHYAAQVHCTDYNNEAKNYINNSISLNEYKNITASCLNWNNLNTTDIHSSIVLLSDVNYDAHTLDALYIIITSLVHNGCTILLATPVRLVATQFIQSLLHLTTQVVSKQITYNDDVQTIYIYHITSG